MNNNLQFVAEQLGVNRVRFNEPMSSHTTFKIGGPADLYYEAHDVNELITAVKLAMELKMPYFILGGGSNILVSDDGIRGLVIHNLVNDIKILGIKGKIFKKEQSSQVSEVFLEASAGVMLNRLVRYSIEEGLGGLEIFLGLPGTVGGAVAVNAHFRPQNNEFIRNLLAQVKILKDSKVYDLSREDFLKEDSKTILLSCVFKLLPGDKNLLWQKSQEATEQRTKTQPYNLSSAGCIFRNITHEEAIRLATQNFTTSAGYLIEQAGLKGEQVGGAKISQMHGNFIVNVDGAKAQDVLELIHRVKELVKEKFGLELKEEIELVGKFK